MLGRMPLVVMRRRLSWTPRGELRCWLHQADEGLLLTFGADGSAWPVHILLRPLETSQEPEDEAAENAAPSPPGTIGEGDQ